jgi:ABC-type phosphate/phosphonate transport system substrate-binding protein
VASDGLVWSGIAVRYPGTTRAETKRTRARHDEGVLRCATWLAPGLPLGLFEVVASAVADTLGTKAVVESFTETSGPTPDDDPFARDQIDLGFLCTPSYRQLAARTPPSVRLVEAAPVFGDERNQGRPLYFAEFVVRDQIDASSLADLAHARIGFNDHQSLSGLIAVRDRLARLDLDESFATFVHTGGHRRSLEMLASGAIDAASIDSNTVLDLGGLPAGMRVLETWGPFPVQPVVVRSSFVDKTREVITSALLSLHRDSTTARSMRRFHVERFAPVTEDDYL